MWKSEDCYYFCHIGFLKIFIYFERFSPNFYSLSFDSILFCIIFYIVRKVSRC